MKLLKSRLEAAQLLPLNAANFSEFVIHDLGFILGGFSASELNGIASSNPTVLQYANRPFLSQLPQNEVKLLNCDFWMSMQPHILQKLSAKTLVKLSEENQRCILNNIHSGVEPVGELNRIKGKAADAEDTWDPFLPFSVTEKPVSDSSDSSHGMSELSSQSETDYYLSQSVRVAYIFIGNAFPIQPQTFVTSLILIIYSIIL